MSIYFVFSDENGDYKANRNRRFLGRHPYYIRGNLIIAAQEWSSLNTALRALKRKYDIDESKEVKWAYLWSLRSMQRAGQAIKESEPFYHLRHLDYHQVVEFIDEALGLLEGVKYKKIFITVTHNNSPYNFSEGKLLQMHLRSMLQRIEMQIQGMPDNLAVLFLDPVNDEKCMLMREIYFNISQTGDFIEHYTHIKDSLNFECSHHSIGIQLADYVSGCFGGFMKGYEASQGIFKKRVYPFLRASESGEIMGYGIVEVPTARTYRNRILDKLIKLGG